MPTTVNFINEPGGFRTVPAGTLGYTWSARGSRAMKTVFLKKLMLLALYLCWGCPLSNGQEMQIMGLPGGEDTGPTVPSMRDMIPGSPNASQLGKFGIVPVSLYSGIPDISIPLEAIRGTQLTLPVSLKYHYNGLKIGEEASWVGMGWSLSAGGVITTIIKDKVDGEMSSGRNYDQVYDQLNQASGISQELLKNAAYGLYDTEPDIYSYSFGEYAGQFTLFNGRILMFPQNGLKITGTPGIGFTITTEEGTRYYFGQKEVSYPKANAANNYNILSYVSALYLSSVTSADGRDMIRFNYSVPRNINHSGPRVQVYTFEDVAPFEKMLYDLESFPVRTAAVYLSSITSSRMNVFFSSGDLRQDIDGTAYSLKKIFFSTSEGTPIREYQFNHGYFGNPDLAGRRCALKLSGMEDRTGFLPVLTGDEELPGVAPRTYSFEYEGENDGWPATYETGDHWGFLNGSGAASVLIPSTIMQGGANREPAPGGAKTGILKKIRYPTGGTSEFEYEPNIYYTGVKKETRNLGVAAVASHPMNDNTVTSSEYVYFTIGEYQKVYVHYFREPKEGGGVVVNGGPGGIWTLGLPGETGNTTDDILIYPVIDEGLLGRNPVYTGLIFLNSQNTGITDSVNLGPGTYAMKVQCDEKELRVHGAVSYYEVSDHYIEGAQGPGLRIRKIITDAGNGSPLRTREYIYKDSLGLSTGILAIGVNYAGHGYQQVAGTIGQEEIRNVYVYTSANSASLSDRIKSVMFYKKVWEKESSGEETHLSMSEFDSYDSGGNISNLGTFLKAKTDYRVTGDVPEPVRRKRYEYNYQQGETFIAVKPYVSLRRVNSTGYDYDVYWLYSDWQYLSSEQEDVFNPDGRLSTSVSYEYDRHHNLVAVRKTRPGSKESITVYKYPESYQAPLMQPLLEHGMRSPVIEQQHWVKEEGTAPVLSWGKITQYNGELLRPEREYFLASGTALASADQEARDAEGNYTSLLSDSHYEPRIVYGYDPQNGNLTSRDMLNRTDSKQVCYLWGYDQHYPVAEVKDASGSRIAYTGFESEDQGHWQYEGSGIISSGGRTGSRSYLGTISSSSLPPGDYKVVVWAKGSGTVTVNGQSRNITASWQRYSWDLRQVNQVTINGNGNTLDDACLYPLGSEMTFYTYQPLVGIQSSTDAKGQTLFYQYDQLNRLWRIKDESGNIIEEYDYHYRQ